LCDLCSVTSDFGLHAHALLKIKMKRHLLPNKILKSYGLDFSLENWSVLYVHFSFTLLVWVIVFGCRVAGLSYILPDV
jgi:hypothetical protein